MPDSLTPQHLNILGVPLTPFSSYKQVETCIAALIEADEEALCVAINPEKIYRAQYDAALKQHLNAAQMHICDGIGAVIAARVLHGVKPKRITGVGLFLHLMEAAAVKKWKVYLLGSSPESNQGACDAMLEKHPDLQIVGHRDGYFNDSDEVVKEINDSGAQLLFVALGSPKQEQWIIENRDRLSASFFMGIGGTLDVVSGRVRWAPAFFRKTGTEWLYRLVCEPKRWRRQACYPIFLLQVLRTKLNGRRKG